MQFPRHFCWFSHHSHNLSYPICCTCAKDRWFRTSEDSGDSEESGGCNASGKSWKAAGRSHNEVKTLFLLPNYLNLFAVIASVLHSSEWIAMLSAEESLRPSRMCAFWPRSGLSKRISNSLDLMNGSSVNSSGYKCICLWAIIVCWTCCRLMEMLVLVWKNYNLTSEELGVFFHYTSCIISP